MCESVAAHYGDAPEDFVVADHVELPWPVAQGGIEWEWRVVSLMSIFLFPKTNTTAAVLCAAMRSRRIEEVTAEGGGGSASTLMTSSPP